MQYSQQGGIEMMSQKHGHEDIYDSLLVCVCVCVRACVCVCVVSNIPRFQVPSSIDHIPMFVY